MKEKNLFFKEAILVLCLTAVCWMSATAAELRGDVDQDGGVTISDVTALIEYLLSGDATGINLSNADTDLDGKVTISDVTTQIDFLLSGIWEDYPVLSDDWVDLGLPSGTIWATRNVGAAAPEDYGDYFAWGETSPKGRYDWNNYKWCYDGNGSYKLTKYNYSPSSGEVDYKKELDPEDDAAYVNYPGGRMPHESEFVELCNSCSRQWTQLNGVNGLLFTGPNGNTMFLPAAGCYRYHIVTAAGVGGYYWSRWLGILDSMTAINLYFNSGYWGVYGVDDDEGERCLGFSVRAVRDS